MNKKISLFSLLIVSSLLFSCATSIGMTVNRPAEIDLKGAESIVVLPFRVDNTYSPARGEYFVAKDYFRFKISTKGAESLVAEKVQKYIEDSIAESTIYTVVNSKSAVSKIEAGLECPAEVYITGQIYNFKTDIDKSERIKKDGDDEYLVVSYKRNVFFEMKYQVINSKNNEIFYTKSEMFSAESNTYDKLDELPEADEVVDYKLYYKAKDIAKSIQPYTETKYLKLLQEKKKSADMKVANELAKNGFTEESYEKYISIYNQRKIFEAGYNAAIILEAQGKFKEAQTLAEELVRKFGDKRAMTLLKDIRNEIALAEKYENQNW